MDDRLKRILSLVIEDVIETGEPVGSQHLVDSHRLDVSPATVRNWFADLENEGYIVQPHTSAGRIPTEKGYRLYVGEMVDEKPLGKRERQELAKAGDLKSLAKRAAELSENAVLLGLHDADTFYTGLSHLFAQPEFRDWNRVVSLGEVLDRLDDVLSLLRRTTFNEPTPLIGRECPFGNACGSILLTLDDGTLVGLLGPMRMDYRQGIAILSATREIIMK